MSAYYFGNLGDQTVISRFPFLIARYADEDDFEFKGFQTVSHALEFCDRHNNKRTPEEHKWNVYGLLGEEWEVIERIEWKENGGTE